MKKCPYCAEEIQDEAIKCRFCGESLKKSNRWKACFLVCLIGMAISTPFLILLALLALLVFKLIFNLLIVMILNFPRYASFFSFGIGGVFRDFLALLNGLWESVKSSWHFNP